MSEFHKGKQLQEEGTLEEAIAAYHRTLELNSNDSWAYHHMGEALAKLGRLDEAVTAYRHAIAIKPDFSWSYHHLGDALAEQQQWEESATAFRKAIELNPEHFGTYVGLGKSLEKLGQLDEAIVAYRRASKLNSDGDWIHYALANALQQRNQSDLAEAITSYRHSIEINPDNVQAYQNLLQVQPDNWEVWLQLGNTLEKLGNIEEALAAYRRAVECNQASLLCHQQLGNTLVKQGKLDEALAVYRLLVELSPREEYYQQLGELLAKLSHWDEAINFYRQAIKLNPKYYKSYYGLGDALAKQNKIDEAISIYHQTAIQLAEEGRIDEALACFQKLPQRQLSEGEMYDKIWKELNQIAALNDNELSPLPSETTAYPEQLDQMKPYYYFTQNSQYKILSLWDLTEADKHFLDQRKIIRANLEIINQDNIALEEIYINKFTNEKNVRLPCQTTKNLTFVAQAFLNTSNEFQKSIVQTGYVYAVCPISGHILRSEQSFYNVGTTPQMLSYRFTGIEIFYLVVGHYWGGKMFIYFPKQDLIIKLSPHVSSPQDIVNRLKAHSVSCWKLVKNYISNPKKKEVVALSGLNPNIGHCLWNDITGLHCLHENGLLNKVEKVITERYDYFKVASLFPEISNKVIQEPDTFYLFRTLLKNNYVAVMPTSVFIKEDLTQKIYQAAVEFSSPLIIQEVENAKKHFLLLWVGIRIHSRVWVSLVEGTANIIKKLYSQYSNLAVVFDGYSRLDKEDPNVESMIGKEQATLEQILSLIPPDIKTYNLIGARTYEKVVWANAIDLYLSSPGSSTTFVLWIANKMGVVHANRVHYATWVDEQLLSRDNATLPVYVPLDSITDQPASSDQLAFNLQNYDFDWKIACDELVKIINKLIENPS